jgi:fatty acid desaturase/cytochrome b involved in lipid metabolism
MSMPIASRNTKRNLSSANLLEYEIKAAGDKTSSRQKIRKKAASSDSEGQASEASTVASSQDVASPCDVVDNVDPNMWYIHGNSYDLSKFVDRHPGGRLALLCGKGRDCTALFESYHPWNDRHRKVLEKYGAKPPPPDPFYLEIQQGLRKQFPAGCGSTKMRTRAKISLSLLLLAGLYCFFVIKTYWSCAIAGFIMATVGTRMAHEGAHMQVSRKEWVNRLSQFLGYFLTGPSMAWMYRHTISHHAHTNQDHDIDVEYIWIMDLFPKWFKVIFVFPSIPIGVMIELGLKFLFIDWLGLSSVGKNPIVSRSLGYAIPEIVIWCYVHWFYGPSLIHYAIMYWFAGAIFLPMSQIAHLIVFPDHKRYDSWAKMQIAESVDFAADSEFWYHLAFGLTTQIEHHLFPSVGEHLLGEIRPMVKEVCRKHGVTYMDVTAKQALYALYYRMANGVPYYTPAGGTN